MTDNKLMDEEALAGIAVAPPNPGGDEGANLAESASESAEGAERDAAAGLTGHEDHPATHPGQQAAQDRSLRQRLRDDPDDDDAKVDVGSDESMDGSDPIAAIMPGGNEPVPSSGFPDGEA